MIIPKQRMAVGTSEDDWAPMPHLKHATPSQIYDAIDEQSTKVDQMEGVVVDTELENGGPLVSHNESLTLTAIGDDESLMEYYQQNKDVLDFILKEGLDEDGAIDAPMYDERSLEEPNERSLEEPNINKDKESNRDRPAIQDDERGTDKGDESTMLQSYALTQTELPTNHCFETYQPNEDQIQKVTEIANAAGLKAAQAGLQLSYMFRDGIQSGMAGMARHLEKMENAVQEQIEANRQAEQERKRASKIIEQGPEVTREEQKVIEDGLDDYTPTILSPDTEEREAAAATLLEEDNIDAPLLHSRRRSFENSTISSMGDTFQEYIKPRLMEQAKVPPPAKCFEETDIVIPKNSPGQPRFIDFGNDRPMGGRVNQTKPTNTQPSYPTNNAEIHLNRKQSHKKSDVKRSRTPSKAQVEAGAANGRPVTPSKNRRAAENPDGRGRARSRSKSRELVSACGRSKSRTRSQSRKRDEADRSRSRHRERSFGDHAMKQGPTQRQSHGKPNRTKKCNRHAEDTARESPKSWNRVVEQQGTKSKASKLRTDTSQEVLLTFSPESNTVSNDPHYHLDLEVEEGIEMVPFKAPSGASGLLIINAGECTMSNTPKAIRSMLQGQKQHSPRPPEGTAKTIENAERNSGTSLPLSPNEKIRNEKVTKDKTSKKTSILRAPAAKKQASAPVKKSLWGRRGPTKTIVKSPRGAGIVASVAGKPPRRNPLCANPTGAKRTPTPTAKQQTTKRQRDGQLNKVSDTTKKSAKTQNELIEMIDAITNFKLTAIKLGVAEHDLLQAMSFASRAESSDDEEDDEELSVQ